MKITKKQVNDQELELTINVVAEDYAPAEKKKLNDYRRTAEFKGFRKGMVPASLIQRVYGEQILVDSVNDVVSEQLNSYITKNKLNILGEPLGSEKQPEIEWKSGNDFKFIFDIALSPEIKLELTKEDTVPYYNITPTAEGKEEMKKNILMQYGSLQEVETPGEESYLYVDLEQEGKKIENAYLSMRDVEEKSKAKFLKLKVGSSIKIDVNKVLPNEADRAALLKVKKDDLAGIDPVFNATVVNIKSYVAAEANAEVFDKIYGKGKVKTEADFEKQVEADLLNNYKQEADYRANKDIREYLIDKAALTLPEDFLKRWLLVVNKGKFTKEQIDEEFADFCVDFKWQLVRDYFIDKFKIKLTEKDLKEAAESYVAYQYAMYGMGNVPQDMIQEAARRVLDDERQSQRLVEQIEDQKVMEAVKPLVTLKAKKISLEKFRELK